MRRLKEAGLRGHHVLKRSNYIHEGLRLERKDTDFTNRLYISVKAMRGWRPHEHVQEGAPPGARHGHMHVASTYGG